MSALPDTIKIEDITSGKIYPEAIYQELDRLKIEVNILRNDMSLFIKALATVTENQSQQEYYTVLVLRLQTVRDTIKDYCAQYNRLLPIVNLAQIKLGQDAETLLSKKNGSPVKNEMKKRNSLSRL